MKENIFIAVIVIILGVVMFGYFDRINKCENQGGVVVYNSSLPNCWVEGKGFVN